MGASHSTPPPLVEVNAPGGKVLVPPGTAFTVHPLAYGPVYTPCRGNRPPRPRPRRQAHRRFGGHGHGGGAPHIDILEGSEDSESSVGNDMMDGMSPRGMRKRYPGPGPMMGGMGRRGGGGPGYFDGGDMRPRSAPEMQMGGNPGMGGMGMGMGMVMPGSPRMGMGGMGPGGMGNMGGMGPAGMGGMGPGGMGGMGPGGMGGMPPSGMPPEYTSNPSMPHFSGGGAMPNAGMNPYASYPGRPPSSSSSNSPPPQQQARRPSGRPPGYHERVPMGAYTDTEKRRKPSRLRTEPQTSARLNRSQPSNKKTGPSSKEWLEGDAFLDACICTTNCNCRKSQRVLYRSRNDRRKGNNSNGDSEDEDEEYGSGEIRYILKEDLGKDCGDHSGCKKSASSSDSSEKEGKSSKNKKKKDKKEEKRRKEEFEGFKDDLLEALDERFEDIKKASQQRAPSVSPARPPFSGGPGMGSSPFVMNGGNMDPRMAQQMGVMGGGDPYGMGMPGMSRMPPGMNNTDNGKRPMGPHPGMGMGMGAGGGMGFEDDMSDMGPMNMGGNPYMQAGMMNQKAMRPDFMSHHDPKPGGKFGSGGMGMGFDREQMAMYAKAMRGGGGGRGGMMGRGGGRRSSYMESESDDFDFGPSMRSGMRQRAGHARAERGGRAASHKDEDILGRTRGLGSPPGRKNASQDRNRGKQPRCEDDDSNAY